MKARKQISKTRRQSRAQLGGWGRAAKLSKAERVRQARHAARCRWHKTP